MYYQETYVPYNLHNLSQIKCLQIKTTWEFTVTSYGIDGESYLHEFAIQTMIEVGKWLNVNLVPELDGSKVTK